MLVHDMLTGQLHEVSDYGYGGFSEAPSSYPYGVGSVVYDGFGEPVGFLPFLPKIIGGAAKLFGGLIGGGGGGGAQAAPPPVCPPCPPCPVCAAQRPFPFMPGGFPGSPFQMPGQFMQPGGGGGYAPRHARRRRR